MLQLAFMLLLIAGGLGGGLAAWHLRPQVRTPPWVLGALHGALGAAGLALLLLALRGPPRGAAMGVAGFGTVAVVLLGIALIAGLAVLASRLRGRAIGGLLIAIHASLAIAGIVILAAYVLVG
jgi:hypothetical protein